MGEGTLYDADEGRVDRVSPPVAFWLPAFGMVVLGVTSLGVGWQWPIVGPIVRAIGPG
jgi:hypothetical protein